MSTWICFCYGFVIFVNSGVAHVENCYVSFSYVKVFVWPNLPRVFFCYENSKQNLKHIEQPGKCMLNRFWLNYLASHFQGFRFQMPPTWKHSLRHSLFRRCSPLPHVRSCVVPSGRGRLFRVLTPSLVLCYSVLLRGVHLAS